MEKIADEWIHSIGAKPAFKEVPGFNFAICASVNEEVVHGLPSKKRVLLEGDIFSVDVGIRMGGFVGDSARTFPVGEISSSAQHLIDVTRVSLEKAIMACQCGNRLSDIGHAVQTYVEKAGYSVVRDYVGHGIGRKMHEPPQIPNFGKPGNGPLLKPGMILAIEPMVNIGHYEVKVLRNGWTVVTKDKSLSAHFEHTVAITEEGPRILSIK